jgi:S-adenosylmethionine:tRNA ribosyltransferase-isomerase
MKLTDFDYQIPEEQIAQHPLRERDTSRLFVLNRRQGTFEHRTFRDLAAYLAEGDVLVVNNTRVIPVRLAVAKPSGGRAEITLLRELGTNSWEALVKGIHEGPLIVAEEITARVSRLSGTLARVDFEISLLPQAAQAANIRDLLPELGVMPLPVYIKRSASQGDAEQYQTVYAEKAGAVAAPTAGLHFTRDLLRAVEARGVSIRKITLHVGYGTFRPVTAGNVEDHEMDREFYEIPGDTAEAVNRARERGARVVAVGTTVTRTLESAADIGTGHVREGSGEASLFIYPGYRFKAVDALVTNFHLPRSTPLMLASAFAGLNHLKKAYKTAREEGYRFYSYGDAMLIH